MRGSDAIKLPAHLATDPGEPKEATDPTHGVELTDRDEIMEAGSGETIPSSGGVIRIGTRIFGNPLAIPTERDVQLIGM